MEFEKLLKERRSVRKYQEKRVSDEIIRDIVSDARMAPSWKNSQTARYYVVPEEMEGQFVEQAIADFNRVRCKNARLVAVSFVKGEAGFSDGAPANELGDYWGAYDLGLASAYFLMAARNKDLDTLIMGIRDAGEVCRMLEIPENECFMAVIAVGYRDGEPVFKPRKDVEEIVSFK